VETWYFLADDDDDKRAKVLGWLIDGDDERRAALAKKLGVPAERVRVLRVRLSADGRYVALGADPNNPQAAKWVAPLVTNFTTDGQRVVLNEAKFDLFTRDNVVLNTAGNKKTDTPTVWDLAPTGEKAEGFFRSWDIDTNRNLVWTADEKGVNQPAELTFSVALADSDAAFLTRALTETRGSGPTALELKYFGEDKDPGKREKLLDALLKEPAVQKKLGDGWKAKMLAAPPADQLFFYNLPTDGQVKRYSLLLSEPKLNLATPAVPAAPKPPAPVPDKLEKLVGELLAAQKSDEAVLEAVTLATLGRLPTDAERRVAVAAAGTAADRKAAWVAVARALAATEPKAADGVKLRLRVEPPVPPSPPAKP
jgi:hypothetical protein